MSMKFLARLRLLFTLLFTLTVSMWANPSWAELVHYELTATAAKVNLSGKREVDFAIKINGSIPAPTLVFDEGDTAEIVVRNKLREELSIHWHGIILPPEMDGVPYVTTPPIMPGKSYTFKFKIRQHGTFWYHSHTKLQEQRGTYGAIVINPRTKTFDYDKDLVLVLSDWSDENPEDIIANLRKDGDYYQFKKKSVRSWFGALAAGGFQTFLANEWSRMGGMDVSDVGYDAFLINGKRDSQLIVGKPGTKLRIRIINAAASSHFHVALGQDPMKVVSADGVDIQPVMAKELFVAMAETYDVVYQIPPGKNTELRITPPDATGFASGWIGSGAKVKAPTKSPSDLYAAMDHSKMGHGGGDHEEMSHDGKGHHDASHDEANHDETGDQPGVVDLLTVDDLRSPVSTEFPKDAPISDLKLVLGGDMERYVWHINGKAIHQDRTIVIKEGDVVRFTFENETMMNHPMHLHGHFFRVLNQAEEFSPLKHTVDVPPHGSRTIEFLANEPGEWMLHCHNLYHMKTGMARVVKYSSFKPKPDVAKHQAHDPHMHDHLYSKGRVILATNRAQMDYGLAGTWDGIEANVDYSFKEDKKLEGHLLYRHWFSNYFSFLAGAIHDSHFNRLTTRAAAGFGYVLPMLIDTTVLADQAGGLRLDLEKRFQWTSSVFSDVGMKFQRNEKPTFDFSLMYGPSWAWSAGVMAEGRELALGAGYRF